VLEVAQQLDPPRQLELLAMLGNLLLGEGVLPAAAAENLKALIRHTNVSHVSGWSRQR